MQNDYVLFGIQGSGKGTQGKLLAEKTAGAYFEMGGELRRLSAEDSTLGRRVKLIIESGNLVPNEVVMEIVSNFAAKTGANQGIIWDGIPRNAQQDSSFRTLLDALARNYTGIYFELSREQAEKRLLTRRVCEKCKATYPASFGGKACAAMQNGATGSGCGGKLITRTDDNADAIRVRIDIFYKETLPIVEEWKTRGKMISVDGAGTIEEVTKELFDVLL